MINKFKPQPWEVYKQVSSIKEGLEKRFVKFETEKYLVHRVRKPYSGYCYAVNTKSVKHSTKFLSKEELLKL